MAFVQFRDGWVSGDPIACSSLAAELDTNALVGLATAGLSACAAATEGAPPEIAEVIRLGGAPISWGKAHEAFDRIRALTLAAERGGTKNMGRPSLLLLFVAENAARVIYNASRPEDPFDSDSAEWLLRTVSQFLKALPEQRRAMALGVVETVLQSA
jgi:hypothetical protein